MPTLSGPSNLYTLSLLVAALRGVDVFGVWPSASASEASETSRSLHSLGSKSRPNASPTTPFVRSSVAGVWNLKPAIRSSTSCVAVAVSPRPLDFHAGSGGYAQSSLILSRSMRRASRSSACCSAFRWCEPGRFRWSVMFGRPPRVLCNGLVPIFAPAAAVQHHRHLRLVRRCGEDCDGGETRRRRERRGPRAHCV